MNREPTLLFIGGGRDKTLLFQAEAEIASATGRHVRILTTSNPDEGIGMCRRPDISVVMMNFNHHSLKENGRSTHRSIRRLRPTIPIYVLTDQVLDESEIFSPLADYNFATESSGVFSRADAKSKGSSYTQLTFRLVIKAALEDAPYWHLVASGIPTWAEAEYQERLQRCVKHEEAAANLEAKLPERRLIVVTGASGVGKTTLQAQARHDCWQFLQQRVAQGHTTLEKAEMQLRAAFDQITNPAVRRARLSSLEQGLRHSLLPEIKASTTRPPRPDETPGNPYYFESPNGNGGKKYERLFDIQMKDGYCYSIWSDEVEAAYLHSQALAQPDVLGFHIDPVSFSRSPALELLWEMMPKRVEGIAVSPGINELEIENFDLQIRRAERNGELALDIDRGVLEVELAVDSALLPHQAGPAKPIKWVIENPKSTPEQGARHMGPQFWRHVQREMLSLYP